MQINKIETSYLLNKEEYVSWNLLYNHTSMKRKSFAAVYVILGMFFIGSGLFQILKAGTVEPISLLWIVFGIFVISFYEFFVFGILLKNKTGKYYEIYKEKLLSFSMETDGENIVLRTDKYTLQTQPETLWKCIETKDLFVFFISANQAVPLPKRALTARQAEDLRAVFMQALPEDGYVNNNK